MTEGKLPDGMLCKYVDNGKRDVDIYAEELIMCRHCDYFQSECNVCTAWGANTEEDGWCYKAIKVE